MRLARGYDGAISGSNWGLQRAPVGSSDGVETNADPGRGYQTNQVFQFLRFRQLGRELNVVARPVPEAASGESYRCELLIVSNAKHFGLFVNAGDAPAQTKHSAAGRHLRIHERGDQP